MSNWNDFEHRGRRDDFCDPPPKTAPRPIPQHVETLVAVGEFAALREHGVIVEALGDPPPKPPAPNPPGQFRRWLAAVLRAWATWLEGKP